MKILMLPDTPEIGASARVFCYQLQPYLQNQGHQVVIGAPSTSAQYIRYMQTRDDIPKLIRAFRARFYWYCIVLPNRMRQLLASSKFDVVLVQRTLWRVDKPPILERLLSRIHEHIVYNFDDALYIYWPEFMAERIRLAKHVWASNETLAEYARRINPEVTVIDAAVDIDYYLTKSSYDCKSPLIIGWVGNLFNLRHLYLIEEPLARIAESYNFRFRVVSSKPFHFDNETVPVENVYWSLKQEVRNLLDFDIGVMPLLDDPYSQGKGGYKLKQYMACALPAIASPVGINDHLIQHGQTGFLASTAEEWYTYLLKLIESVSLREGVGQAARSFIERYYSLQRLAPDVEKLLRMAQQS